MNYRREGRLSRYRLIMDAITERPGNAFRQSKNRDAIERAWRAHLFASNRGI